MTAAARTARRAPWEPLGRALLDYLEGDRGAVVSALYDGGGRDLLPAAVLFRAGGLPSVERAALELAAGRVLDAGAGAGAHALALAERGLEVVALDLAPGAVEVMARRGVADPRQGDVFGLAGETFDTVLMLMNGVGLAGDLAGLDRLLGRCAELLRPGGALVLDSCDLRRTEDREELARLDARRGAGRYFGEVRFRLRYRGLEAPPFPWLFVDPRTLRRHARAGGWRCQVVYEEADGTYLARLTR